MVSGFDTQLLSGRTWGDSLHLVFGDIQTAAECAMALQRTVGEMDLAGMGVADLRGMRVAARRRTRIRRVGPHWQRSRVLRQRSDQDGPNRVPYTGRRGVRHPRLCRPGDAGGRAELRVQLRGDDSGSQGVRSGEALQPAQTARRWSKLTPGHSVMDSLWPSC